MIIKGRGKGRGRKKGRVRGKGTRGDARSAESVNNLRRSNRVKEKDRFYNAKKEVEEKVEEKVVLASF